MVGTTISHYKVLEKIDQGGMGVVYLAEDSRLNRNVAMKFQPFPIGFLVLGRFRNAQIAIRYLEATGRQWSVKGARP
jgi:hypothetical protein